jgi:hypothetical protein
MGSNESARKIRDAAEREAQSGAARSDQSAAKRKADTAAAEATPEMDKHEYGKAKSPRR